MVRVDGECRQTISAVVALGARVACNGDVDLRQLRYFVAVAEARGFRSASRALFVAQPALSSALQQLEGELGVELLHRTARGVALTDAGREFLTHAHSILRQTDEATAAMRECARRFSFEKWPFRRRGLAAHAAEMASETWSIGT